MGDETESPVDDKDAGTPTKKAKGTKKSTKRRVKGRKQSGAVNADPKSDSSAG